MLPKKQDIQNYWAVARPNSIDIAYSVAATLLLVLVITAPTIFDKYNTFGARDVLASGLGGFIGDVLIRIDQVSFTKNAVTFLLWSTIGMIVYGFVSSLVRALSKAEFERELAGDDYIHPSTFSRTRFWREELFISATTVVTFMLLVAVIAFVTLMLLPGATVHLRSVVVSGSQNIWAALSAVVLLMVGVVLMVLCYKLWRHRMVLFEGS